jgi:hypothetical protein
MKEYSVHFWDYGADDIISGETVIKAVEKNFERIAKRARIGNVAGYRLAKVVLEYHAAYGSMLHEDEEYSDIPEFMWPIIREVGWLTGYYHIPLRDEMPA